MHFAKPVKFPVEGQVLENAENADQEAEKHSEPNEPAPILKGAESLHSEKEKDQVGEEKQEFHPSVIGGRGAMQKPLRADKHVKPRQLEKSPSYRAVHFGGDDGRIILRSQGVQLKTNALV